jgi:hypothetical protein
MALPPSVVDIDGADVPPGVWLQADDIITAAINMSVNSF